MASATNGGIFRLLWPALAAAVLLGSLQGACGGEEPAGRRPVWGWRTAGQTGAASGSGGAGHTGAVAGAGGAAGHNGIATGSGGAAALALEDPDSNERLDPASLASDGAAGRPGVDVEANGPRILLDELRAGDPDAATPGLPAISADGTEVALPLADDASPCACANLAIRFVAVRTGKTLHTYDLLNPREGEALAAEASAWDRLAPGVLRRTEEVRARLARGAFRPLRSLGIDRSAALFGEDLAVEGAGLSFAYDAATEAVTIRDGLATRFRGKLAAGAPRWEFCDGFRHDPRPSGAFVSADGRVLVLRSAFLGNDSCWEPPDAFQVVRLLPLPERAARKVAAGPR